LSHFFALLLAQAGTAAADFNLARPDSHAPIGVMGDHTHGKGEFMFSYRYRVMWMHGNRSGTSNRSRSDVLTKFPITPTRMTMEMHMLGAMWAPTDRLTVMGMVPFIYSKMDHRTRTDIRFRTKSERIGDSKLTALYLLHHSGTRRLHLNLGVSLPTGSVDEKDDTPAGRVRLPYPMQIGSGTYDLLPGLTLQGQREHWSWGTQTIATLRFYESRHDYQLGNCLMVTGWLARSLLCSLSTSIRIEGQVWGNIHGADPRLNEDLVPTADPDRRAGRRVDLLMGLNWYFVSDPLKGNRLAVGGVPPSTSGSTGRNWRPTGS
jgi:hypothetical protein